MKQLNTPEKKLDMSMKQLYMSTKKYNMWNWKATTERLRAWIKINKT